MKVSDTDNKCYKSSEKEKNREGFLEKAELEDSLEE